MLDGEIDLALGCLHPDVFEWIDAQDFAGVWGVVVNEFLCGAEEGVIGFPVVSYFVFGCNSEPMVERINERAREVDPRNIAFELMQRDCGMLDAWVEVGFGLRAVDPDPDDDGVAGVLDENTCDFAWC